MSILLAASFRVHRSGSRSELLVLIEPDLATLFPDGQAVNRALRLLAETARVASEAVS